MRPRKAFYFFFFSFSRASLCYALRELRRFYTWPSTYYYPYPLRSLADIYLNLQQEASAALALVNANKNLPTADNATHCTSAPKATERHHHRVASAQPAVNRTSSPATMFDKFGRKMFTPPMTRSNSTQGSIPGTPRREQEVSRLGISG